MIRTWIALALLSASWLLGLSYLQPARWLWWSLAVVLGVALLAGTRLPLPSRRQAAAAVVLLLPAVLWLAWPHRAVAGLLFVGLALTAIPIPRRWPVPLGRGAIVAAVVLLAQGLALAGYAAWTAGAHELPDFLVSALAKLASFVGLDAARNGSLIVFQAYRAAFPVLATWEFLLDLATLAFLIGGSALALLQASQAAGGFRKNLRAGLKAVGTLAAIVAAWLPIRAIFLFTLLHQRIVRTPPTERVNVMDQMFSVWLMVGLLAPLVLAAWRLVAWPRIDDAESEESPQPSPAGRNDRARWLPAASAGLAVAAGLVLALTVDYRPVGLRQDGRVMFVDKHCSWERTDTPYNTEIYDEAGSYNFAALYNYCTQYYDVSRLMDNDPIDDDTLDRCDVLVVKTITERWQPEEVAAVERFVDRGGGLLLIGEHTDPRFQGPYMNDLAGQFGFCFRSDLLFRIGQPDPYRQWYAPPRAPHPIVQRMPRFAFAVSCRVDPGRSIGDAVICDAGLWSLPADYHADNFFPEAEMRTDAAFGPFIQLWTTAYGSGRVAAWTDSTVFSNFAAYQPGKPEAMIGMLEWLNRRTLLDDKPVRVALTIFGLLAAAGAMAGGAFLSRGRVAILVLLAGALGGWALGQEAVAALHRAAMPVPEIIHPIPRVMIDRRVSTAPLSIGAFTDPGNQGFGLLEQWIPRLGYVTQRAEGDEAFAGDVLVVLTPTRSVSDDYREKLQQFVEDGGKLLVIDGPQNVNSTANGLLFPFGMLVRHTTAKEGVLGLAEGWPDLTVPVSSEVIGGDAFMWVDGLPVAALKHQGKGSVMVLGFATMMNDENFGGHWQRQPTAVERKRFDVLYALVRSLVEDKPVQVPASSRAKSPASKGKTVRPRWMPSMPKL